MVSLRPMEAADLELVRGWLGQEHVARWFLTGSTVSDELEDLRQCVAGTEPTLALVVLDSGRPVGWCQWYLCSSYPDHAAGVGAAPGDVGIDYAIGDPALIGSGVGTALIAALVAHIRQRHPDAGIIADPEATNAASRRVLSKNGFGLVGEHPVSSEPTDVPMAIYRLAAPRGGALRTIGMLGGMSWESTAEYYRLANEMIRQRLGGLHSAHLILHSLDFADIEQLQVSGAWEEAGEVLADAARGVEAAGADLLILCTNTMHKIAARIEAAITIPFLHIVDPTAAAVSDAGLSTVGLLGTAFTMEQDFYRDRLAAHGLRTIIPESEDRAEIHRIIYDELCHGIVTEESRGVCREIITRVARAGAQGLILGCTEIELLITDRDSPVPIFPTTRLHVAAAVDWALSDQPVKRKGA
jgi:aspartate racemase